MNKRKHEEKKKEKKQLKFYMQLNSNKKNMAELISNKQIQYDLIWPHDFIDDAVSNGFGCGQIKISSK